MTEIEAVKPGVPTPLTDFTYGYNSAANADQDVRTSVTPRGRPDTFGA
jgi:hypothetical protein